MAEQEQRKTTLLIVEDNEANRDMLSRRLIKKGFEIKMAVNGQEGIEKANEWMPDLILMDMSLPIIDGWEATRRLKADPATQEIPVIALTAHAMAGDKQKALAAGCDDYDTKPVDLKRLLTKINRFVGENARIAASQSSEEETHELPVSVLFENAPDAMILIGKAGKIERVNRQAECLFGYKREELINRPVEMLTPTRFIKEKKGHWDQHEELEELRMLGGIERELWGLKKDGSEFPLEISLSPIQHQGDTWICSAIRDASEKKQLNQQNLAHREQLNNILENVPGVIYRCLCKKEWPVVMISSAIYNLIGYHREEFLGENGIPFLRMVHPGDRQRVEDIVKNAVDHQTKYEVDYRLITKEGAVRWVSEMGKGLFSEEDGVWYVDGVISDITERKAMEEALLWAKNEAETANRAKSSFLANMSHELRTPMNAIIGYSEMLIEDAEDQEQPDLVADLDKIKNAGKHLLELINDVLDLSKVEAGKMELLAEEILIADLIQDVQETVSGLIEQNENQLAVEIEAGLPLLISDYVKLKQCLLNLASNAAKFTEKGTITLKVYREGEKVNFIVADTGIGIAEDKIASLFDEFTQADETTTREHGGTGLGLAITQKFCALLQGEVFVESTLGKGTTFRIELPWELVLEEEVSLLSVSDAEQQIDDRRPVLIIEDDPHAADLIERILVKDGYSVVRAKNGIEGVEMAKEVNPFVITLDVMLPEKDGWSVLREFKEDPVLKDIPVIIISVLDNLDLGYALGAEGYMTKPVRKEVLLETIEKCIPEGTHQMGPVLIVDDEPDAQQLLDRILSKRGLHTQIVSNGKEALEAIFLTKPSLILLDLMMPVMDGFTFMKELRKLYPKGEIPVIVVTARELSQQERAALTQDVDKILHKGAYDKAELMEQVKKLVNEIKVKSR